MPLEIMCEEKRVVVGLNNGITKQTRYFKPPDDMRVAVCYLADLFGEGGEGVEAGVDGVVLFSISS